jgi:hypothetical protein
MTFINEFIPANDISKYAILKINKYYLKDGFQPQWTIDRARDIYIRQVASGRDEFADQVIFTFFWKGTLIEVRVVEQGGGVRGGEGWSDFKLQDIRIPKDLADQRAQILSNLKEALAAYSGGGVYSSRTVSKTTFNF